MRIAPENEMSLNGVVNALFSKKATDEHPDQLAIGVLVELEHGLDRKQAEKIARDHLEENQNYYTDPMKKNWGSDEAIDRVDELTKSSSSTQIFVLDDDQDRIDLFKKAYGSQNVVVASNVKGSLNLLRSGKFAKVFLDRDLSSTTENGEDVAWQMKQEKLCQETPVVIHSENTRGQKVMAKYLGSYHSNVTVVPFRQLKKQLDIPGGIQLPPIVAWTAKRCPKCGNVTNVPHGTAEDLHMAIRCNLCGHDVSKPYNKPKWTEEDSRKNRKNREEDDKPSVASDHNNINKVANEVENDSPRRWSLRVTFDDGEIMPVEINGKLQEVKDYYLNNEFVLPDETTMHKPINVEVLEDMGPAHSTYHKGNTLNKQIIANSIPDTRCPSCGIVGAQNSECKFCHKHIPGKQTTPNKEPWNQPADSKFEQSWEKRLKQNDRLNRENKTAQVIDQNDNNDEIDYITLHLDQVHQIAEKYAISLDLNDVRKEKDPTTNEIKSLQISFGSYELDGIPNTNGLHMLQEEINNLPGVDFARVMVDAYRLDIYLNDDVEVD
jgi:CheY-like chemotaxis protein